MPSQTTDNISLHDVLATLPKDKNRKGFYFCPVCNEQRMSVKKGDSTPFVVSCFTPNCKPFERVLEIAKQKKAKPPKPAYDSTPSGPGLTVQQYSEAKRLPADWLSDFFLLTDGFLQGIPAVAFPYCLYTGQTESGEPVWKGINTKWRWGMGSHERRWEKGSKACLYGEMQLLYQSCGADGPLEVCFIVEGESDTQTLSYNGIPVLGVSGTGWHAEDAQNFLLQQVKTVYVIQEPGEAAEQFVKKIANSFASGRVRAVKLAAKDVSELWVKTSEQYGFDEETTRQVFVEELQKATRASVVAVADQAPAVEAPPQWEIETISADKIAPTVFEWMWEDRIPLNKFTLFFGLPGQGKSTVAIDVAAHITTGSDFGDRKNNLPVSDVLMLIAEDELDDTVIPRLIAAGADRSRVHFVMMTSITENATRKERRVALNDDMQAIERTLARLSNVRLIVLDPVSSYLGNVNPNKSPEVRPLLEGLKDLARKMSVTVIGIAHFNKNADQESIHRISGAGAWGEVPRSLWAFVPKPIDEENATQEDLEDPSSLMLNAKLNNTSANKRQGLTYKIEGVSIPVSDRSTETSRIKWLGKADDTLGNVMQSAKKSRGVAPVKTLAAEAWLKTYLEDGPQLSADIFRDGEKAGHKQDTLYKAKERMGLKAQKAEGGRYRWCPSSTSTVHEDGDYTP